MNKNDVLEIYNENYKRVYEYSNQLKVSVNKGLDFLLKNQLDYGEFKTEICNRYKDSFERVVEEWTFDSSPFATALILYSLNFIEGDERVQKLREQGLKFLIDEMEEGGLWRYWSSKNEKHRMIPPDLDVICCISHILKINNIAFPENTEIILNNRNRNDIFNTWLLSVDGKKGLYSNDSWIINQEDDICCLVNSNVLLYLGEIKETEKVVEYLIRVILQETEITSTPFYNNELSFYYMLSRAYYNGSFSFKIVKQIIINKILNMQKSDGSFGNELLTSLAICSLLNYGYYSPDFCKAIAFLIKTQQSDGSWRRIPLYGGHADKAIYGSAELTTAFCLEALARYELLDASAEHQERQELKEKTIQVCEAQEIDSGKNKSLLLFFRIIRSQDWWLYKIPPLLAIAYAEILLLDLPVLQSVLTVSALLFAIACVAAYGHIINDSFDIEADRQVGKSNSMAQFLPWQRALFCLVSAGLGFILPSLMNFGTLPTVLLGINYLLPTLYSAPPFRFKEKGVLGIISDAAGAHAIPTLFVATTFSHLIASPPLQGTVLAIAATAWSFVAGVRGILLHQLWDRDNDLNAGICTFITRFQLESVRFWINRFIFPCEIALFGGLAIVLSQFAPLLPGFFIVYVLVTFAQFRFTKISFDPSPLSPPVGQNIIPHDLYEVWFPLALATLLATRDPIFLVFLGLTFVFFYPSIKMRSIGVIGIFKIVFNYITLAIKKTSKTDLLEERLENLREQLDCRTQELEVAKTETDWHQEMLQQVQQQTHRQIEQLQTQLQQTQAQLEQSQGELVKSQSDLQYTQDRLKQIDSQLQQTQTELTQSQSELQTSQTELTQLKSYLQQTQGVEGMMSYYRFRIASNPDDIQLYHQALTIKPDDTQSYWQLGNALVRQNRFDEAIASYQTALQFQPDNFEIHLELGKALEKEKKWDDAIAAYQRAIELNPDYSWSHKHLGDILAECGQHNEASLSYRRALQLLPRIF